MAAYGGDRRDGGPNSGQAATPQAELEKRFMDSNYARDELAWWAYREIRRLREELQKKPSSMVMHMPHLGQELSTPIDKHMSSTQLRIGKLIEEAAELGKEGERHLSIIFNDEPRGGYFWHVTLTSYGYVTTTSAKSLRAALTELVAKVKAARKTPAQELAEKVNAQFKNAAPIRKVRDCIADGSPVGWIVFQWKHTTFIIYEGEKPRQEIVENVPDRFVSIA